MCGAHFICTQQGYNTSMRTSLVGDDSGTEEGNRGGGGGKTMNLMDSLQPIQRDEPVNSLCHFGMVSLLHAWPDTHTVMRRRKHTASGRHPCTTETHPLLRPGWIVELQNLLSNEQALLD